MDIQLPQDFFYAEDELVKIKENFVADLSAAAKGETSSLLWLSTQLPENREAYTVKEGEFLQIMAIGGSNYHGALYTNQSGSLIQVGEMSKLTLEKFKSAAELYSFISSQLDSRTMHLGLNFAYGLNPVIREARIDGSLRTVSKGISFDGLLGEMVGAKVEEFIRQSSGRDIRVSVANDVVSMLMSAPLEETSSGKGFAGGVVGTGFNLGLVVNNSSFVNLEAGKFSGLRQTESGQEIDRGSTNPGEFRLEKELAGAHLWQHYNFYAGKLGYMALNSTAEMNDQAKEGNLLAKSILKRSANLTAAVIAGLSSYIGASSLTMVMEGSLFWKAEDYQEQVKRTLDALLPLQSQVNFIEIPASYINGPLNLYSAS